VLELSVDFYFRLAGMAVAAVLGWFLGDSMPAGDEAERIRWNVGLALAAGVVGLLVTPYLTTVPARWLLRKAKMVPVPDLLAFGVGLILALIVSALLAIPLSLLPSYLGRILPFAVAVGLCYMGISIVAMRKRDLMDFFQTRRTHAGETVQRSSEKSILVDTSSIIDGRVADICQTGFLDGSLLVPRFVLDELHRIADSSDSLRRNRGRRGLEMLNKLQKHSTIPVKIVDMDATDVPEVDGKLVKLARTNRCAIITNDYNLNRVAELQGVRVLNVNELANAVKPVVLPGEEMRVRIVQEGKELGQGVGYLDDGTMIVVENGRRYINSDVDVVVTRVLQTVAGRMIFAHLKGE
jgi:uncharacterized protein YacL